MKTTLQNNFTTIEQSKLLLELGVPADSADFYYSEFTREAHIVGPLVINYSTFTEEQNFFPLDKMIPCWSAGRLIEIYLKCAANDTICDNMYVSLFDVQADNLVGQMIYEISHSVLDFSKLEE